MSVDSHDVSVASIAAMDDPAIQAMEIAPRRARRSLTDSNA